jgi:hypothetical protein
VIESLTLETIEYLEVGLSDGLMETILEEKSEHKLKDTISRYYIVDKNNIWITKLELTDYM